MAGAKCETETIAIFTNFTFLYGKDKHVFNVSLLELHSA